MRASPIQTAPAQKATARKTTKARQAIELTPFAVARVAPPKARLRRIFPPVSFTGAGRAAQACVCSDIKRLGCVEAAPPIKGLFRPVHGDSRAGRPLRMQL